MSVAVPVIDYIDGSTRRIFLRQGVVNFYPIEDIYHEYRYMRSIDESLRKWEPLLKAEGNVPKGGGAFTPRYVVLLLGTKLVPYNEASQLNQLGDMITDDPDTDATLYDISGLTVAKAIFIKPSEAETIQLNSDNIEFSSFNGGVTVDTSNKTGRAVSGITFPAGTDQSPCNNLIDAKTISTNRGFNKIYVKGNLNIIFGTAWEGYEFVGESALKSTIIIDPAANVFNCEFYDATVSGTLDGSSQIEDSVISGLDFVDGFIYKCAIGPSPIILGTSTTANIFSCYSTIPGSSTPTIDMNGTGTLALRDYFGGMLLINYNGTDSHSIDLSSGELVLSNTITSGTFIVRGVGKLVDTNGNNIATGIWNSGVTIKNELITASIINSGLSNLSWTEAEKEQIRYALGIDGVKTEALNGTMQFIRAVLEGDIIPTLTEFQILDKLSKAVLVSKTPTIDGLTGLTKLEE